MSKGESVQILGVDHQKGYYFIRKLIYPHDDGWVPLNILQNPNDGGKKPWSFRFRKPSFSKKEKENSQNGHVRSHSQGSGNGISSGIGGGSSEDVMDLFDEHTPVFCHELRNLKCLSGEEVTLQCQLCVSNNNNKFEAPVIFWKDAFGHVIRNCASHEVRYSEDDGLCTLRILESRVSDSGRYTCTATSDAGSGSTSAVLSVTGKHAL